MPKPRRRSSRRRSAKRRLILIGVAFLVLIAGAGAFMLQPKGTPDATPFVANAREALTAGDPQTAIIELKNALQRDPDNVDARWLLGDTYLSLGQGAAAAKELQRAQSLGRQGDDLTVALLRANMLQGRYREVLGQLATSSMEDKTGALTVLRGQAQLGLRNLDAAQRNFEEALGINPDSIEAQRGLARVALAQRNFEEADKLLATTLDTGAGDAQSMLLKGELELSRGGFEAAMSAFEGANKLIKDAPAVRIGMVRSLLGLNRTEEAQQILAQLHEITPNNPLVNYFRGVAARQLGDIDASQEALRDVLRVQPNHAQSLLLIGSIEYSKGEYRQAEEHLARFVSSVDNHVPGRKLLAAVHLRLNQPQQAIDVLRPVLEMAPEDPQLLAMLGSAYLTTRDFQRGSELLERAAALDPSAAAIRTQLALSHLASGASDKAVSTLQGAVEVDPTFTRADLLLIFTHLRAQEWDRAIVAAQALIAKQPDDPVPLNLLGAAYAGKQQVAEARAAYEKALALNADYLNAELNLAALDAKAGDTERAAERYRRVIKKDPGQPQASLGLARLANRLGDADEAIRILETSRSTNPQALQPRLVLAGIYLRHNEPKLAFTVAEEATRIAPNNPVAMLLNAQANALLGELGQSERILGDLVVAQPKSADARYQLALVQLRQGKTAAAADSLEQALENNPQHFGARVAQGDLAVGEGRGADALAIAEGLLEQAPGNAAALILRGDAYMSNGETDKALADYQLAQQTAASSRLALKLYGALATLKRMAEGRQVLATWLENHPEDATVRLALASMDQQDGKDARAAAAYEKVLADDPSSIVALNNLAWLYFSAQDPRALEHAKRAYDLAPRNPAIADTYGWFLVKGGKLEQGLTILERAAKGAPSLMEIQYHLAAALAEVGDKARARSILEQVMASEQAFAAKADARSLLESL